MPSNHKLAIAKRRRLSLQVPYRNFRDEQVLSELVDLFGHLQNGHFINSFIQTIYKPAVFNRFELHRGPHPQAAIVFLVDYVIADDQGILFTEQVLSLFEKLMSSYRDAGIEIDPREIHLTSYEVDQHYSGEPEQAR